MRARALAVMLGALLLAPSAAFAQAKLPSLFFKHDVQRRGFHFQLAFGLGGGPDNEGLFHAAEMGGTLPNGITLCLLHTFIQNKDFLGPNRGPDLLGGWNLEIKVPIVYAEFELKASIGPGGLHDQSDGIKVIPGLCVTAGFDFHLPFFERSGLTFGFQAMWVTVQQGGYFGLSGALGYTFF